MNLRIDRQLEARFLPKKLTYTECEGTVTGQQPGASPFSLPALRVSPCRVPRAAALINAPKVLPRNMTS